MQYGNGPGQAGEEAGNTPAVTGTFTWKEPSTKPVVADSNVTEYTVVFTPSDTANYNPVEAKVTLTVNKAQNAPNMPGSTMDVSNSLEKAGDILLPEGWEWQASDRDTALEVGKPVSAVAVYAGADKGNYEKETVTVSIIRSACDHVAGDVIYTGAGEMAPTCTENGLGHRECTKCGSVVESGIVVKTPGHTGGTATCSKRAVCTRCGQTYGDTDGSVHGDTEVRRFVAATCTAGGYTGDTYCKDCGVRTKTGNATPALGHDWHVTGEEAATTTSEGRRIYTCGECGQTREESIPKLPQPTHTHRYGTEWKSDNSNHWHECSCGEKSGTATHIENGGSVTKAPTETEKGVRTYKCSVCGYVMRTEEIGKLPPASTETPTPTDPEKQPQETVTPGEVRRNSSKLDSGIYMEWKGKNLVLKWSKIAEAEGYDIFANQSGRKLSKESLVKTVKNGKQSVSLTKVAGKKLSGKKMYSVKIKAWKYVNGKKIYIGNSRTYHVAGKENRTYTNAKKLKLAKEKYVLKKGKSARIKVTVIRQSKKKKLPPKSYGPVLQYWSDNEKIATVTQGGRVMAKKKGTCYIYVTTLNGVRAKIKIIVK